MTDIIDVPCEILVIETGFTRRINRGLDLLYDFCLEKDVVPLFIYDDEMVPAMAPLELTNKTVIASTNEDHEKLCKSILDMLTSNNLDATGNIAFRIDTMNKAHKIYNDMEYFDYCDIIEKPKIKFLGKNGKTYIMYVKLETEG